MARKRRKEKKNKAALFATILLIGLMGTSILGFLHGGDAGYETRRYDDFKIKGTQIGWELELDNGETLILQYLPESTNDIELTQEMEQLLTQTQMLYVTSSFSDSFKVPIAVAHYYLAESAPKISDSFIQVGFTDHSTSALPEVTCSDATPTVPVLFFKEGNTTGVSQQGSCVVFEGTYDTEFIRFAEKIVYERVGIDTSVEYNN